SLSGTIAGGLGSDSITGNIGGETYFIPGGDAGNVAAILTAGFTSVENLVGGTGTDSFVFAPGGLLTGTINGGSGTDTITGNNGRSAERRAGNDAGNMATILTAGITSVENLVGGT